MQDGQRPPKRTRRFLIEDILDGEQIKRGKLGAENFIELLNTDFEWNEKFKLIKHRSSFQIRGISEDPEAMLAGVLQHCLDEAIHKSREHRVEPEQVGCIISSQLLDPDLWIPVRPITKNTVDAILNRFLLIAQSKTNEGSLLGEPFTITITCANHSNLPSTRRIVGI